MPGAEAARPARGRAGSRCAAGTGRTRKRPRMRGLPALSAREAPGHGGGEVRVDDMEALLGSAGLQGRDRQVYLQLRKICDGFYRDYGRAMLEAWDRIDSMDMGASGGGAVTPGLRAHIVDMIKMGLDDGLAAAILDRVYLQRGEYGELCGVCRDILAFEGYAGDRMVGSTLPECVINQMISRLSAEQGDPRVREELAGKCAALLRRRAAALGIGVPEHKEEFNPLYRASLVAMDVYARRALEPPQKIATLLRGYPLLWRFLELSDGKAATLAQKAADLTYHASIAIHIRQSAPRHLRPRAGLLDYLESLLRAMESRGIDAGDPGYAGWRDGMRGKKLVQYSFEMRLYLHLLSAFENLKLEPPIDNGKHADFKVRDLYIEAFAPHDAAHTAFGNMRFANPRQALARKIRDKKQVCSFGSRRAVIIVDDPHDYVDDPAFQEVLARRIAARPQLAAVFVARDIGDLYRCAIVRNPEAALEITPETEQMVTRALGTPYMRGPKPPQRPPKAGPGH